jgi:hypothetical protein
MATALIRRIGIVCSAVLLLGSFVVGHVSAMPPPVGGTVYKCQNLDAGYSPVAWWEDISGWGWDGRLRWEVCVAKTSSGSHYAIVRLSSPSDLVEKFDRYTGLTHIYLQRCAARSTYVTVASKDWAVEQYSAGTLSGSRYQFTWLQTPSTTSSALSYRIHIVGVNGAVVPRNGGWSFSLEPEGFYPAPGNEGIYNTGCLNP